MAYNPDISGYGIRDRTEICKHKFHVCYTHPKLKRQEWLEIGQAEFNVWSLGLNASDSGQSSLDYKVRRRAELREDITDLLDALAECLSGCLDPELLKKIDDKSNLSPQDDPESPLYYKIFNIKEILKLLWIEYIGIREHGTRFRYHKATAKFKSILNQRLNGLRDYTIKATLAGLEKWNWKERFPSPWENATKQREEGRPNEDMESQAPAAITVPAGVVIEQIAFEATETTVIRVTGTVHENLCLLAPKGLEKFEFQHFHRPYYSEPLSRKYLLQWAWM